jgi:electron transfer flavoprotein alpha subunit
VAGILVVAEHRLGEIRDISLELITAAKNLKDKIGGKLHVTIIARDPSRFIDVINREGVDEIIMVAVPDDEFNIDVQQQVVETLIKTVSPTLILLGNTINSLSYGPALAAKLSLGFASDVIGLNFEGDSLIITRQYYEAKVNIDLDFPGKSQCLIQLRAGAYPPTESPGNAEIRKVDVSIDQSQVSVEHLAIQKPPSTDVDIAKAPFLLSIGRGIAKRENIEQFERLAAKMGATLSCSRPLVDRGWLPNSRQVGLSGKTVKPKVYLAFGISGGVLHLMGMKNSSTIIAVNTDPYAPLFSVADYAAVCDMFELAQELERQFAPGTAS